VIIDSQIPPGKGLKSSSAVCNAVTTALLDAIGTNLEDMEAVDLGVEVSRQSGISLTGALDDALASYLGGFVVTDNLHKRLILRSKVDPHLRVVLKIPLSTLYTREVDLARMKTLSKVVDEIHQIASRGEIWNAMTLNGLAYAPALGIDSRLLFDAIEAGALAATVTGTGPALAAVCDPASVQSVKDVWSSMKGNIWTVGINNTECGASTDE
jgi:shikimate kinase